MKRLFRRPFWLIGFLPAIIGTLAIYRIYTNMQPWISMMTDFIEIAIVALISYGLTIIAVPCLIFLTLKKQKDVAKSSTNKKSNDHY